MSNDKSSSTYHPDPEPQKLVVFTEADCALIREALRFYGRNESLDAAEQAHADRLTERLS